MKDKLKIIPYYTGCGTLQEASKNKKARELLWLEILLNDSIAWKTKLSTGSFRKSYKKACLWYGNFVSFINAHIKRAPLKAVHGHIDAKDYRKFVEAITFVSN
ncbi:hypothetical protein HZC34_05485 [Candidatus Saganbacteria bacterium]|nr:hypothetical protein [Candidatus Saganbacteria bacterium]